MSLIGNIGKALSRVVKVVAKPVASTIVRTVVGSVPVLGGVVSAVGAVKSQLHPPTRANTANLSARTGAPAFGHPGLMVMRPSRAPRHATRRSTSKRRRARGAGHGARRRTRKAGGSAKQRAARARFARAAKRGPIRKGTHL